MRHIPRSSRIFIGVLVITMLLTYIALHFATYIADQTLQNSPEIKQKDRVQEQAQLMPKLNTEDWENYQDKTYPIAFLHPENWIVKGSVNKLGFYDLVINPGAKFYDIHIYVSKDSYYGLDSLKQTPYKIDGKDGFKVADNLFGIKTGEYYYTFDASLNSTQKDEFITLLDTVKFDQAPLEE